MDMDNIIDVTEPQPGDWADHVSGDLDPREVARVEGDSVWLLIFGNEIGPFPRDNYTYIREA